MIVSFDLNGTLLDPGELGRPWGAGRDLGLAALEEAVTMSMADTLTGVFRPFPDLLRGALGRRAALAGLGLELLDDAMDIATELPPYPEAAEALGLLIDAGHAVAVVSNSARDAAQHALAAAGLDDLVQTVVGADAVSAYKPDPRVYAAGPGRPGDPFVAGHWWDITGAARAGHRTVWVSRDDRELPTTAAEPDVRAVDLRAAAHALLESMAA